MELLHYELTEKIIRSFFLVHKKLGYGFLEKVYEKALLVELKSIGLKVIAQHPINVFYKDINVGHYFADIVVNDKVILELKATDKIKPIHEAQLINYLKATRVEVGLIFNFGIRAEFVRKVYSNSRK